MDFTPEQQEAIDRMADFICNGVAEGRRQFVLHGLAGTGKTTVLSEVARHYRLPLCTLTGKAASVLRKKSGLNATTLHSATGNVRDRQAAIEASAMLNTFGAGSGVPGGGMAPGLFWINPAFPEAGTPVGVMQSARRAHDRSPNIGDFLSPAEIDRAKAYTEANRKRSEADTKVTEITRELKRAYKKSPEAVDDLKLSLAEAQTELEAAKAFAKNGLSDNSIGRQVAAHYEVLPPGVVLPHMMGVKSCPMEHIGFVMESLQRFAEGGPIVGAHLSSGCGRLCAEYTEVLVKAAGARKFDRVGTLFLRDNEMSGSALDGFVGEALDAWRNCDFDPEAYRDRTI